MQNRRWGRQSSGEARRADDPEKTKRPILFGITLENCFLSKPNGKWIGVLWVPRKETVMALGRKTGGRRPGTPNKRSGVVSERFEELGLDPLEGLIDIARDPRTDVELRARILMDLMGYLYPKRKALDTSPTASRSVVFNIGIAHRSLGDSDRVVIGSKVDSPVLEAADFRTG
jgi:hypothetical protein